MFGRRLELWAVPRCVLRFRRKTRRFSIAFCPAEFSRYLHIVAGLQQDNDGVILLDLDPGSVLWDVTGGRCDAAGLARFFKGWPVNTALPLVIIDVPLPPDTREANRQALLRNLFCAQLFELAVMLVVKVVNEGGNTLCQAVSHGRAPAGEGFLDFSLRALDVAVDGSARLRESLHIAVPVERMWIPIIWKFRRTSYYRYAGISRRATSSVSL